jgi:hypothetical protein
VGRWKKDAKEFVVGVNFVENRGYSSSIPKPIIEKLGDPNMIKFVVSDDNNSIQLVSGMPNVKMSGKVKAKLGK